MVEEHGSQPGVLAGPALTADSGFRGGKAEKAAEVVLTEGNLNER